MSAFLMSTGQTLLIMAAIAFVAGFAVVVVEIARDAFAEQPEPTPEPIRFRRSLTIHNQRQLVY